MKIIISVYIFCERELLQAGLEIGDNFPPDFLLEDRIGWMDHDGGWIVVGGMDGQMISKKDWKEKRRERVRLNQSLERKKGIKKEKRGGENQLF